MSTYGKPAGTGMPTGGVLDVAFGGASRTKYSESGRRNLVGRLPAAGSESRRRNLATSRWSPALPDTAMAAALVKALARGAGVA